VSAVAPVSSGHAPQALSADAAGLLYERHSRRIFGYCLSLLGSREDAEDAVQTTFINAQRGLRRGVVPQFELAWLFKIARNVCYNARESTSRRGRVESARDLDALQDVLPTPDRPVGVSIGELTRALEGVPERQRRALLLREFQGLSYEEIATKLDVSVAAVETLIFRARRSVAEQLEQTGTSRFGALAVLLTPFRWLLKGGAAPAKLAAVGATVATTATLVVVPAVREQAPAPAPAGPRMDTPVSSSKVSRPAVHHSVPAIKNSAPASQPSTLPAASTPATSVRADQPAAPPSAPSAPPAGNEFIPSVTPPRVSVPSVTVSDVTTPPIELTLPEISLPQVDLPVEIPPVPPLSKLP
jgi:RNA polymerase sigma-70 factor, ECF subfamily